MSYLIGNLNRVRKIFCPPAGAIAEEIIVDQEAPADVPSFIATEIPQNFDHLIIYATLRSDRAFGTDYVRVKFNEDAVAANYRSEHNWISGSSPQVFRLLDNVITQTSAATSSAANFGLFEMTIPYYADSYRKQMYVQSTYAFTSGVAVGYVCLGWLSSDPITSIELYPDLGTNFVAASQLTILATRGL